MPENETKIPIATCMLMIALAMVLVCRCSGQSSGANPLRLSPHHSTTSVADLEKEAGWYERALGFQRSNLLGTGTDFQMYQMTIPGYRIDLVQQKGSSRLPRTNGPPPQGWLHVVFKTPDLDGAYKHLVEQGIDVKATRHENSKITRVTFDDPEGNQLEIVRE